MISKHDRLDRIFSYKYSKHPGGQGTQTAHFAAQKLDAQSIVKAKASRRNMQHDASCAEAGAEPYCYRYLY